jgi:hypothetical protein
MTRPVHKPQASFIFTVLSPLVLCYSVKVREARGQT